MRRAGLFSVEGHARPAEAWLHCVGYFPAGSRVLPHRKKIVYCLHDDHLLHAAYLVVMHELLY
jgi:hypothetical protein